MNNEIYIENLCKEIRNIDAKIEELRSKRRLFNRKRIENSIITLIKTKDKLLQTLYQLNASPVSFDTLNK